MTLVRDKSERIEGYLLRDIWHKPEPGCYFISEEDWILTVNLTTELEVSRQAKLTPSGWPLVEQIVWAKSELSGPDASLPA